MIVRQEMFLGPFAQRWAVLLVTACIYLKILNTFTIQRWRNPLVFLINFATWRLAYGVTGHGQVDGATASGFLLVASFGNIIWFSSLWASGFTLERARQEGTSAALFLSPASRAAVVVGNGLGSMVQLLPTVVLVSVVAMITGARLQIVDLAALLAGVLAMVVGSLAAGFALSGLFILSRRGGLIATTLQMPIYLLAGFVVPPSRLPDWLQPVSNALSVTHAAIALRQSALLGRDLRAVAPQVLLSLGLSALYVLIGHFALRRVEYVARRAGKLDLF